jgi:hypothetical protein
VAAFVGVAVGTVAVGVWPLSAMAVNKAKGH